MLPLPHPHSFLRKSNHTDSSPMSGFFHCIIIQFHFGFTIQLVLEGLPISRPTFIVKIAQNAVPFLMGIVAQTAVVSTNTIAPSSYLYTGIPFVQVFFFGSSAQLACLLYPATYTKLTACTQQFILQQQYIQNFRESRAKLRLSKLLKSAMVRL